jgi:hypothetical protein
MKNKKELKQMLQSLTQAYLSANGELPITKRKLK